MGSIDGGDGTTSIDFTLLGEGLTFTLDTSTRAATMLPGVAASFAAAEHYVVFVQPPGNFSGTNFNVGGSFGASVSAVMGVFVDGGQGNDEIVGSSGDDVIIGGLGADFITGGEEVTVLVSLIQIPSIR